MPGFGFGEGMPPSPEEQNEGPMPHGVRGVEDFAIEAANKKESEMPVVETPENIEAAAEAKEIKVEMEHAPEAEREKIGVGIHNIGFFVEETKNNFFAGVFNKIASTQMQEKSTTTRFIAKLGEQFEKDAKKAHERIEAIEKTKNRETLANAGYLAGNIVKYGRTALDVAGWTVAAPLRYVTLGAMAFSRGADAAKELRLENEKVIEKTRIDDMDKAAEEAWKIHDAAKTRAGGKETTAKNIEKAYREALPQDILKRLEEKSPEQPNLVNRMVQGLMKVHIRRSVERLEKKTEKIEKDPKLSAEKKKAKRERLFNRFDRRLRDYDRVVGQLGTVDALAMGARYAEVAGKVAAYAPSAYIALEKAFGMVGDAFTHVETSEVMDGLREQASEIPPHEVAAIPAHAVAEGPAVFSDTTGHGAPFMPHLETQAATPDVLHQPYGTVNANNAPSLQAKLHEEMARHAESIQDTAKTKMFETPADATGHGIQDTVKTKIPETLAKGIAPQEHPMESAHADTSAHQATEVVGAKGGIEVTKPTVEFDPKQIELATIHKGEGVTHAIARQLKVSPEKFGYDPKGGVDVDRWAVLKSKAIAIENGYIKPDGSEIRVFDQGPKGNPAYLLKMDASGKFKVAEYLEGKPTGGEAAKNAYEYEWKKPVEVGPNVHVDKMTPAPLHEYVHEMPVKSAAEVVAKMEPMGPMAFERVPVAGTTKIEMPAWLTERLEYDKIAGTLPEKAVDIEVMHNGFENLSLHEQAHVMENFAAFEKQLDYLDKHADAFGLTPSQEDFVEISKDRLSEMHEILKDAEGAFKEQLDDVGVSFRSYETVIAGKGITVKDLFDMETKKELDTKKWGAFARWIHALRPVAAEQGMKIDDFLKSLTPENFLLKNF